MALGQDAVLQVCKAFGLFRVARFFTRRGVRILCYHGFARTDEVLFRPSLFITLPTFERRLRHLVDAGYAVVTLDQALADLDAGVVRSGTVVLTVDDVFHNFVTDAWPLLDQHHCPATAYVTTYYCQKESPVFRLVVRYAFWKTRQRFLELPRIDPDLKDIVNLDDPAARASAESAVVACGEAKPAEDARVAMLDRLGPALEVDLARLKKDRIFTIVTREEVLELVRKGVDIQLHTHRHRLPADAAGARTEIDDNRAVLESITGRRLTHLCYPSGIWSEQVWPFLRNAGIASATTCDTGLNFSDTPRLGLKRILDAEDVTQIRFEAEVAGFKHLIRWLKAKVTG